MLMNNYDLTKLRSHGLDQNALNDASKTQYVLESMIRTCIRLIVKDNGCHDYEVCVVPGFSRNETQYAMFEWTPTRLILHYTAGT